MTTQAQFERDGFVVARGVLDPATLARLAGWCGAVLEAVPGEHRRQFRSQGSCVDVSNHPEFAEAIGHPALGALLQALELGGQVISTGSVIGKPPGGPALFWHQDWWGWDDPVSRGARAPQVNVMVYLDATSVGNGCLRVIPGSHRRRHPLHDVAAGDPAALCAVDEPDHPLYRAWPDECAVPVQPGDVVVKDARLLHGAYPNRSGAERTLLSLNYNPGYAQLPAAIQATIAAIFARADGDRFGIPARLNMAGWPPEQLRRIAHLVPVPPSGAQPQRLNFRVALP